MNVKKAIGFRSNALGTSTSALGRIEMVLNPPYVPIQKTIPFRRGWILEVPSAPGVYIISDLRGVLYIGRADNLRRRIDQHYYGESNNPNLNAAIARPVGNLSLSWCLAEATYQAELERRLIQTFTPPCNRLLYKTAKKIND